MFKLLLLATCFLAANAFAGLYIEPYAGYSMVSGEQKDNGYGGKSEYEGNFPHFGSKLGISASKLLIGVDYNRSMESTLKIKANTTLFGTLTDKYDATYTLLSGFVGFQLPALTLFAEYFISGELEAKPQDGGNKTVFSGKGYSLGAGISVAPKVQLNFEYQMITLDEYESNGTTTKLTGNEEVQINIIQLYLGVPIDF